jgi:hypothetical protein
MTTTTLADMARDEACIPRLDRYREAALREIQAANWPRHLALIKSIQPAIEALQAAEQETK